VLGAMVGADWKRNCEGYIISSYVIVCNQGDLGGILG
jgi:hypothetical protein